ncbi:hypothetical protein RB195_004372 [Necator americanus]|uniref:Uncharacterized protein n=1 Tax=Necator americanus TaxID=51031 RepID=A0ABR1BL55_NECAM
MDFRWSTRIVHEKRLLRGWRMDEDLEGSQIVETSSYVYLGHSMNMESDLEEDLNRRMKAKVDSIRTVSEATNQLTDLDLPAHLFDPAVLSALYCTAET